ncbi:MAG TPA: hypothetical protein ENK84_08275 [Desulfobulbus sp.]|nr:hypothetical protein [Desulfobulbus sp.]
MERPEPEQSSRAKKSSLVPIILVSLFLCATLAGLWLFLAPSNPLERSANRQDQAAQAMGKPSASSTPTQKAATTTDNSSTENDATAPIVDHPKPPAGETTPATGQPEEKVQRCKALAARLHGFFSLLDNEEYFRQFKVGLPAQQYFLKLAKKLLSNPPVVSRETDDLYTMLKNMAHFFRVIGGRNITIIKTILDRERDTVEDVAADLYQWTTGPECDEPEFSFHAPIEQLYEYAGFFLNSISGRSYLFRRDSRSRLLVNYYAILLVNEANKEGDNRYGIDLRALIPRAIDEIEHSNQLIYKEKYLDTLYGLMEKYPQKSTISRSGVPDDSGPEWKKADPPVRKAGSLHQG